MLFKFMTSIIIGLLAICGVMYILESYNFPDYLIIPIAFVIGFVTVRNLDS